MHWVCYSAVVLVRVSGAAGGQQGSIHRSRSPRLGDPPPNQPSPTPCGPVNDPVDSVALWLLAAPLQVSSWVSSRKQIPGSQGGGPRGPYHYRPPPKKATPPTPPGQQRAPVSAKGHQPITPITPHDHLCTSSAPPQLVRHCSTHPKDNPLSTRPSHHPPSHLRTLFGSPSSSRPSLCH
ncbi:hypothetical protein EDB81DRAFT_468406 [Dactylonectria macrodidyma]|uniref:Uncharacterized protein n=1 Tax=Dactylonectria macrodidyma TaxID=307937 RepID=A0A9P9J7R8_9HYPO|nr:hypothetical protein EDB81DRAFT_468406 [Dactylonectria macrodidyma]